MSDARHPPRRRDAFTLIELIVVMALILAVAAVGIGYAVYGQDNNHSAAAAAMVQGAALNARSRAHLDGKPTGVRILFNNNQATQLLLIQQPEDYNLGQVSQTAPAGSTQVNFSGVDFQGGADYAGQSNQTTESTVEAGDYFTVPGQPGEPAHRIHSVSGTPPNGTIVLDSPLATNLLAGTGYAIVRGPRRIPSEDVITLPSNMVIDNTAPYAGLPNGLCQNLPLRTLVDSSTGATTSVAEVVFSSAGPLTGQGATSDNVLLWLRDASPNTPPLTPLSGAPQVVSIQVRTGLIGVYSVAPWNNTSTVGPGNDPFAFTKDPRASGS